MSSLPTSLCGPLALVSLLPLPRFVSLSVFFFCSLYVVCVFPALSLLSYMRLSSVLQTTHTAFVCVLHRLRRPTPECATSSERSTATTLLTTSSSNTEVSLFPPPFSLTVSAVEHFESHCTSFSHPHAHSLFFRLCLFQELQRPHPEARC